MKELFGQVEIEMLHGFQSTNPLPEKIGQLPVIKLKKFFIMNYLQNE